MNVKIGLKLWSTNKCYVEEAKTLFEKNIYQYIELFAVPKTFETHINIWKDLNIPFVIHAPHFRQGLNLAKEGAFEKNNILVKEALNFADELKASAIIFHPGIDGNIKKTIEHLKKINDDRILIENMPRNALDDNLLCNGYSTEEIQYIINEAGVGFCLDFGHAIYAANAVKKDPFDYIKNFLKLSPKLFHLSDGDLKGILDRHDHLGSGYFDIERIIKLLPQNASITLEVEKSNETDLNDFVNDVNFFRERIS